VISQNRKAAGASPSYLVIAGKPRKLYPLTGQTLFDKIESFDDIPKWRFNDVFFRKAVDDTENLWFFSPQQVAVNGDQEQDTKKESSSYLCSKISHFVAYNITLKTPEI
jgi:hypothetical protein